MKVAYLVNRYPTNSHTFIRREIQALEALGIPVERFSLRPVSKGDLADADYHAELERTRAVLSIGALGLFAGMARTILTRPLRFLAALRLAIRVGHRSDRGMLNHLAYLI